MDLVEVVVVAHVQEARRAVRLDHLASRARLGVGRPSRSGTLGAWHEAWAILLAGIDRERQHTRPAVSASLLLLNEWYATERRAVASATTGAAKCSAAALSGGEAGGVCGVAPPPPDAAAPPPSSGCPSSRAAW